LIPLPIQVGTAIGIGLLTTLAGCTEISLVVKGSYNVLKMGVITPQVCISFFGVFLICVAINYHIKGSFCLGIIVSSLIWWTYSNSFPDSIVSMPYVDTFTTAVDKNSEIPLLTADLIFLYLLYLNGIVTTLSKGAGLNREDNSLPRGRWIFVMCGLLTMLSGFISSAPILVSPESSASIKAGAKTGLSTVVCGFFFLLSLFFSPLLENVPSAGSSPVLIMIGVILFQNVSRLDWKNTNDAAPAFIILFFIPFTYSIIQGVVIGYIVYLTINLFSGDLFDNSRELLKEYVPWFDGVFERVLLTLPVISKQHQLSMIHKQQEQDSQTIADPPPLSDQQVNTNSIVPVGVIRSPVQRNGSVQFTLSDDAPTDICPITPPPSPPPSAVASTANINNNRVNIDNTLVSMEGGEGLILNPMLSSTNNSRKENQNTDWGENI